MKSYFLMRNVEVLMMKGIWRCLGVFLRIVILWIPVILRLSLFESVVIYPKLIFTNVWIVELLMTSGALVPEL